MSQPISVQDTALAVPRKIIDKFKKIFTPLQAHGKGKITAWRSGKFSLATQKNKAVLDKQARSNKILQNKQK